MIVGIISNRYIHAYIAVTIFVAPLQYVRINNVSQVPAFACGEGMNLGALL